MSYKQSIYRQRTEMRGNHTKICLSQDQKFLLLAFYPANILLDSEHIFRDSVFLQSLYPEGYRESSFGNPSSFVPPTPVSWGVIKIEGFLLTPLC